jgi:hypothetical protein
MVWWLAGLALIAFAVAALALDEIMSWLEREATIDSSYGELVKERLSTGEYRVVAGVFTKRHVCQASKAWVAEELDEELEATFGNRRRVRVCVK